LCHCIERLRFLVWQSDMLASKRFARPTGVLWRKKNVGEAGNFRET
jgi:hypothetical protein